MFDYFGTGAWLSNMTRWSISGEGTAVNTLQEALEIKQRSLSASLKQLAAAQGDVDAAKIRVGKVQSEIDEVQAALRVLSGRKPKLVENVKPLDSTSGKSA